MQRRASPVVALVTVVVAVAAAAAAAPAVALFGCAPPPSPPPGPVVVGEGEGAGEGGEGEGAVVGGEGEGAVVGSEGEGAVVGGEGEGAVVGGEGEGAVVGGEGDEGFDTSTRGPYDVDGAFGFTQFDVDVDTPDGSSFTAHVTLTDAPGARPVIILAPGTQQPMSSYQANEARWASYGVTTIGRDDPGPLGRTPALVDDILYLRSTWMPAQNVDAASALFGRLDLARVGAAGHSRGGKATLMAAEQGLDVLGYFGIDAVDVTFIDDGVYAVTDVANVGIPTVFLVASIETSCSPADYSGDYLYAHASTPSVKATILGAGHTQFASPCVGCTLACSPAGGDLDDDVVLELTARYSTAFFARLLLDDDTVGPVFEGAGAALDAADGLLAIEAK